VIFESTHKPVKLV